MEQQINTGRRLSRREALRGLGLSLGAGALLAACAPQAPATPAPAEPQAEPQAEPTVVEAPAAAETVTISYWTF
jgi:hypothetical protein